MAIEAPRRRPAAIALVLLLVLIGAAAGIAVDRLLLGSGDDGQRRRRGPPTADQVLERYRERIGLTDEQVAAIRPILVKRIRETTGVLERVDPELDAIRRAGDDEVRAHLRPDQLPKLEQLRADFEKRRAEMRNRLK